LAYMIGRNLQFAFYLFRYFGVSNCDIWTAFEIFLARYRFGRIPLDSYLFEMPQDIYDQLAAAVVIARPLYMRANYDHLLSDKMLNWMQMLLSAEIDDRLKNLAIAAILRAGALLKNTELFDPVKTIIEQKSREELEQLERMLFTVDAPSSEILFPQRHVNYSGPETIATLAQTSFQELRRPSPRMASIQLLAPLSSADAIELSKTLISGDRARQDVQQSIMRTKLRLRRGVY